VIPGKKYRPEDYLRVFMARKWLFIVPFLTVALTTALIVYFLPDRYRSRAVVQVVPPRIPANLIRTPGRAPSLDSRMQNMAPRILNRTRLESLISEFNLYTEQRRTELMEDVIERMNRDISVNVVRGNAFQVSYEAEDRVTALRVTARLAQLFIDESYRDREVYTQGTSQFIDSQLEETRQRLVEHEKKLEEYRRLHAGELPTQLSSNLTGASNAQMQLQSTNDTLSRDRDRLQALEREQNDLMTQESTVAPPPVVDTEEGTGTAAQRLEAARRQLRQMELRLKPEHPDVVRAKRVIADLEQKAEAEALQTPVSMAGRAPTKAEKARQERLSNIKNGIDTLRAQIARRERDADVIRDTLARYQSRAEAAPTRETELIELNRDYDTLRQLYADLLKKSQESQMVAALDTRQIGEQFRLLEGARAPERPVSPNRPQLNLLGVIGGIALGLAFIALAEYRDTTFKTDDDIMTTLSLPVLAMIPNMVTRTERRHRRRRRVMMSVTAVLVALAVAATAVWFVWHA
jgi:polysaccharide chain length determinant protein (PEP-CTERM system associated)